MSDNIEANRQNFNIDWRAEKGSYNEQIEHHFIKIQLYKYCQTSKGYIRVTSSSADQPETLAVFLCGSRGDRNECSFDVETTFKFKRPAKARKVRFSKKICFNSKNGYCACACGHQFARIDVIFAFSFLTYFGLTSNFRIF